VTAERAESVSRCTMSSAVRATNVDDHHPDIMDTGRTGTVTGNGSGTDDVTGIVGTDGGTLRTVRSPVSVTKSDSELLTQSPTFDDSQQSAVYVHPLSSGRYLTRDSIMLKRVTCITRPSVYPSVCHTGGSQDQSKTV